jgi:hypothetical protein
MSRPLGRISRKCTSRPSHFISSSVYDHEVFFETYAPTVDVDPVPPKKEPTEAEGDQYLQLLKDAMRVHMYAPQANASSGLEVLRALESGTASLPLTRTPVPLGTKVIRPRRRWSSNRVRLR